MLEVASASELAVCLDRVDNEGVDDLAGMGSFRVGLSGGTRLRKFSSLEFVPESVPRDELDEDSLPSLPLSRLWLVVGDFMVLCTCCEPFWLARILLVEAVPAEADRGASSWVGFRSPSCDLVLQFFLLL